MVRYITKVFFRKIPFSAKKKTFQILMRHFDIKTAVEDCRIAIDCISHCRYILPAKMIAGSQKETILYVGRR